MAVARPIACSATISFLALGAAAVAPAQERPDLSGSWILNVEQSDDMREHVPWSEGSPPRVAGRRPGLRGGRRPGGGRLDPDRVQQTMRLAREGTRHMTIEQSDSTVTITYSDGSVLALHTDGKKTKVKVEGGGDVEIKAQWKKDDFVVERTVSGGGKVKESFLRPPDRDQMYVIVEIEIGPVSRAAAFRRVYDLDASS